MDGSSPGSSVQAIFQARILEWVAISFSRRDALVGRFFTAEPPGKPEHCGTWDLPSPGTESPSPAMAGGFFLRYLILYISGWYFLPGPSKFLVHFVTSALPRLVRGMHNHVSPGLKDTHRQPENSPWQAVSLPSVQDTGFCFPVIEPFGHGTCFLILRPMKRQISALKFRCLNGLKLEHIYSSL